MSTQLPVVTADYPPAVMPGQTNGNLEHHRLIIPVDFAGQRLDQALAAMLPHLSRNRLQHWIKEGLVRVISTPLNPPLTGGKSLSPPLLSGGRGYGVGLLNTWRAKDRLQGNEWVEILGVLDEQTPNIPQPIPLDILYEDADLLIINKPPGLIVHPGAGNLDNTLQNGLLHWDANLIKLPRCGIVHRLDKDTSGLLVVARSLRAHTSLTMQLQTHAVQREYLAVVTGLPVAGATIELPIGRHPTQRTHMAVVHRGKPAITHFQVQERFAAHSLLLVRLATGRTHQIRVHLAHINYPLVGDPVYGGRSLVPSGLSAQLRDYILSFHRQALHARRLSLTHPGSGKIVSWEVSPPVDMLQLLEQMRVDC